MVGGGGCYGNNGKIACPKLMRQGKTLCAPSYIGMETF